MKIILWCIVLSFVLTCFTCLHATGNMEPPETAENQAPEELIFLGESPESLFAILSASRSRQVQSLCIRELSWRGMKNIELLKKKISRESTLDEQDFAAEILLHIDNVEAKNLACKYYVSQLANSLYVYKNYYHYPVMELQAGDIKEDIIINGKKFKISLIPAAATIPLLKLKEIALPHLVKILDRKYDNIIPALNAYWLIENILKKELPPFGEVWQNADIVKKIIHDNTLPKTQNDKK